VDTHIENRRKICDFLRRELVGPAPLGEPVDPSRDFSFDSYNDFLLPRCQTNGEEILQRERPAIRYGVGVLYPQHGPKDEDAAQELDDGTEESAQATLEESAEDDINVMQRRTQAAEEEDFEGYDLSDVNAARPSSMGISFLARLSPRGTIRVSVTGGTYVEKPVKVRGTERAWWLRRPVRKELTIAARDLDATDECEWTKGWEEGPLRLALWVLSRPFGANSRLLTVCLVNRSSGRSDTHSLFQAGVEVAVECPDRSAEILPYPKPPGPEFDAEEESLALLYRDSQTYAVGHGCSADWSRGPEGSVTSAFSSSLPLVEIPSITPSIHDEDGKEIRVSMAELAGLVDVADPFSDIDRICELYEAWVEERFAQVSKLDKRYQGPAKSNLARCSDVAQRIRQGMLYLKSDQRARRAFELANHAILLQQLRSVGDLRKAEYNSSARRFVFSPPRSDPDPRHPPDGRGYWRPFQIAFILMCLRSSVDGSAPDRKTVDLLWFPTGGGKTEAYLGLAAFSLFHRRLKRPDDTGVHVLMRYTLRLLTAQQFQRAAGLICAMEYLRRQLPGELGTEPFSIGIWVGSGATPNTRKDGLKALQELNDGRRTENHPFILTRCPWCSAMMGRLKDDKGLPKQVPRVLGYERGAKSVVLRCPDHDCAFHDGLPVVLIDEDLYECRPSLVIGTVDKFATLAWRPEARALFGIEPDGSRRSSPPGLIIQDELHLISGPLGSLCGLYEVLIEELCTDHEGSSAPPKIVCSTATIRRYAEQVRALYGRTQALLFPPPALDARDSFFARYATRPDGELSPGRLYMGVYGPGLRSLQTSQVRVLTALLQAPVRYTPQERDPWWTVMVFFNSLRELGTTLTLFQSDIINRFKTLRQRLGLRFDNQRKMRSLKELTGRLRGDEIPEAIEQLKVTCTTEGANPIDVCLASNIIEVGVDIDRLSLMVVVGQPKSTAQYIQVTGRIGRRWWERPGLVLTLFSPTKPRDRSHYEKFRSYHERLYAQVEPSSVTPFSLPVLERALHALLVSSVRQVGGQEEVKAPHPYPNGLVEAMGEVVLRRVRAVEPEAEPVAKAVLERRKREWQTWEPVIWTSWGANHDDYPLLHVAGSYIAPEKVQFSWATPITMRNVDKECLAKITSRYIVAGGTPDD